MRRRDSGSLADIAASSGRVIVLRLAIPLINLSWHGGVRVLVQIANFLAERGHDVSFVVSRNRVSSTFPVSPKVNLTHVGICTRWKHLDYLVFLLVLPFALPSRSILLANFFVTYYPVRLSAFLRRSRYFYLVQDIEAKYTGGLGALLNMACKLTYGDQHIIAANAYLKERLRNEYHNNCKHIAIGPAELFYARPRTRDKKYDLIYFLRGEPWKGLERFTRILQALPEAVTCLCVSQDDRLLRADSSRVHYRKPVDDDELIDSIDSSRLLLFTSYVEGFALPPLEAMARGVPAILFRCGGPDIYVKDGRNSIYVETEQQAAAAICGLLEDHERYRALSEGASATAQAFKLQTAMQDLARLLEGAASSK